MDKRMVLLSVNSPHEDILPWGSESIYYDGELLGSVTSVAYNHRLSKPFCLGMVSLIASRKKFNEQEMLKQGQFEVEIAGRLISAEILN